MNSWSLLYDVMNDLDWVSANGGFEYTPMVSPPDDSYKSWEENPERFTTFSVDMSDSSKPLKLSLG